jgi:hypothetical protein
MSAAFLADEADDLAPEALAPLVVHPPRRRAPA